ncbi:LacI family transcriptional regulator [Bordetella tumbae]|uniref:tripartite tricarboxylate transporter substrate binding protein n=1 Tax=Bordetella tumbae TaxID=1649139 RepID=UPI0039EF6B06
MPYSFVGRATGFARKLAQTTGLAAALLGICAAPAAHAAYPDKPIRMIVPQPPGGFNDTVGRLLAKKMSDAMGQPVLVENQPGAGSQLGTTNAARSPADGYTILVVSFAYGTNPALRSNLPYDTARDFTPLIFLGQTPNLLVVNSASPYKSLAEVLDYVRKHPGKLSYASSGVGSSPHLSMEMLKSMAKVDLVHIPYKGGAPMATDLLGGQVDIMFDNTPNLMPYVTSGKMRALAVTSAEPSPYAPGVPTVAQAGVPGYAMTAWYGLVVRSGTPVEIVEKLNTTLNAILKEEDVRKIFAAQSVEPVGGTSEQFGQFLNGEFTKWAKVIKDANITAD